MPELPEVETVVRDLDATGLRGSSIAEALIFWDRTIAEPAPLQFSSAIRGLEILGLSRRGKFIVLELSGGTFLLVHLRMTGRLRVATPGETAQANAHDRVVLSLTDGRKLRFSDPRKFGRMWLTTDPGQILGHLGPEPLDVSCTDFSHGLAAHSRELKPLLLDQSFLAGIGNIYADEALWAARLHPQRKSTSLSAAESKALLASIKTVLRRGIRNLGTSLGSGKTNFRLPRGAYGRNREHLCAYGQTGSPCPRCGTPIARILVGQRSTHVCPACQPPPTPCTA